MFGPSKPKPRDIAQRLIQGHVALTAYWALKHAGVLDKMLSDDAAAIGLDPLSFAESAKLAPDVLESLLRYLATVGLVIFKDNRAFLTPEARALCDQENGALELIRSYSGIMDILEHLLVRLKTVTPATARRFESAHESQNQRWLPEVFPALEELIVKLKLTHILDISCGSGELLTRLARRHNQIVGVGIGADGPMVRRANQTITAAGLEKRLIAVTASPLEVLTQTAAVFDRIGISRQLWSEIDALLLPNTLGESTSLDRATVVKTLAGAAKNFPKSKFLLIEPCTGPRFDKNYYAAEWSLLLSLAHAPLWTVEDWRAAITAAGLKIQHEAPFTTDGTTIFLAGTQ